MDMEVIPSLQRKKATSRLCNVSSYSTELLELHSEKPSLHILFIPGNPGITSFYRDFVEALYELFEGNASVTAIGHISQTRRNWENGRIFSLDDQINHKVDFIKQEVPSTEIPIVMVGHSIGSYISLEIFKRFPQKVRFSIGLYPFLTLNKESIKQSMIGMITGSPILSAAISSLVASLGLFPTWVTNALVRRLVGQSWSATAVDAASSYLLQYHTVRNVLFMAMTEFRKLSEEPDWIFMRKKQNQIALLFGTDDHWGPLSLYKEISKQVPDITLSIEREGHSHAFCCTEAGSSWAADHVARLIKNHVID